MILALDLGSTQLKLMLMDDTSRVCYLDAQPYATLSPRAGWLEQRPQDWADALERGMRRMRDAGLCAAIDAIGFSGHMSGVVLLDDAREVLHPCIMLSDSRSEAECAELIDRVGAVVRAKTGNPVINAFSLPKLLWLKRHRPQAWGRAKVWLAPKDYLRYLLTGLCHTDCTDAYNSLCVSRETGDWCDEIIAGAGLEQDKFAPILRPDALAGRVTAEAAARYGLTKGTPVFSGGADMACGALGMGLFSRGESALTLGTCATFLAPVSDVDDAYFGQVTFHLHAIDGMLYALGSHFNGGLAVNWLSQLLHERGELDYEQIRRLSDEACLEAPGCGGVLTLPFLAGSGSPYFRAADRQTILGLHTAATRGTLFRSELEGITLNLAQTKEAFDHMIDGGLRRVLLGGGGSRIGVWPQMIADVFGTRIDVTANADASTVGAAILAGMGAGIFRDGKEAALRGLEVRETLLPDEERVRAYRDVAARYQRAYQLVRELYD